jgi:two-component system, LytTR family, sensor kinase
MKFSAKQHIIFWIGYMVWDLLQTLFSILGNANTTSNFSSVFFKVAISVLVMAVPRTILFYFISLFILKPLVLKKQAFFISIFYAVPAVLLVLLFYRTLTFYYLMPRIFKYDMSSARFFDLSSLVTTLFDLLVPVCLLLIYELYRYSKSAGERESKLEKEKLMSELSFLKAQINPHFLFNVLSTVHALSRTKAPEAADVTLKLSQLMRFMLFETKRKKISILQEVKILEDYIELEKVRFSNKLSVNFEKAIDDESQEIAPLVLLPFVENAFKHGSSESRFNSFVNIRLVVTAGELSLEVENSFEASQYSDNGTHIGLANIKRQLQLIYPQHKLVLEKREQIFFASLNFKLQENEEV